MGANQWGVTLKYAGRQQPAGFCHFKKKKKNTLTLEASIKFANITFKKCILLHALRLLTLSLALLRVATLAAGRLLQVVGFGPTTTAQGVRLVPALTER